jgi:hypothetical protein
MRKSFAVAVLLAATLGTAYAQTPDVKVGDKVTVDGKEYLVGLNQITNPHFNTVEANGTITGWTVGNKYGAMTTSNFTWNKTGGTDGGAWIKAKGHTGAGGDNSIATRWTIKTNTKYYFSFWVTGANKTSQYIVASITANNSTGGGQNEGGTNGKIIVGTPGSDPANADAISVVVPSDATQWAQTNLFFDSGDYTYLQFNARWLASAWGFDNFYLSELYDPATTSKADLLRIQLQALVDQTQSTEETTYGEYAGIMSEVEDVLLNVSDVIADASATADQVQSAIDQINSINTTCKQGVTDANKLNTLVNNCIKLQSTTSYPGFDAFSAAVEAASTVNENKASEKSADFSAALATLTEALKTYRFSQQATADAPADYTFLIQHPWFCNDDSIPASNSLQDIAAAKLSSTMLDSEGWVDGSTATGGDRRLNYTQNRTCWNSWNTNFTGYLDIHQNISNLPNGYYSITCDAITQSDCVNDQHAYVITSTETVNSPAMTKAGWNADDVTAGEWEAMSTATTKKALVNDGKLTIGFRGTHDTGSTNATNGWFCVTNYKLQYYGKATLDDLAALYKAKVAACQAQCDTMLFKGDKANYQKVIEAYKNATDEASINLAIDTLNKAASVAGTSISKQVEVLTGSYKAIKDSIAAKVYDATLTPVMQSAVDAAAALFNAEGQTYACRDSIINSMRAYRFDYANEYNKAMTAIAGYKQQSSKDAVNGTINGQLATLKSGMLSNTAIATLVAEIEKALADASANELMNNGGTDYTSMLANPTCEGTAVKDNPKGWTINMTNSGNGQPNSVGQQYDGNTKGYYLDAWNGTAKTVLFNAHQTVKNLPNGTYTLKAMCRTSGNVGTEGTYLYTIADNDSLNGVKLAMVKREQCNITTASQGQFKAADGTDSLLYVMDSYGSIWEAAATATSYGTSGSTLDLAIYGAHTNIGYGWHYVEVPAIVKNHELTIGFTNDSTFTGGRKDIEGKDCVPFTGTWISADNFTLTLTALGDNNNWSPVTGINDIATTDKLIVKVENGRIITNQRSLVYSVNGQLVNASRMLTNGVYIVKSGRQVVKVVVK